MCSSVFAQEYTYKKTIALQKDEQKKFLVKYDTITKLFTFRWTLYKNEGLVLFRSYDRVVFQNILYINYKNRFIRQDLLERAVYGHKTPYIFLKFQKFDFEHNKAVFILYLYDDDSIITLEELKNNN